MNTTNNTNDTKRISRKDYRKACRKAIRTKRAKAKAAAAQKRASLPKEYDIFALFDTRIEALVRTAIKDNKFKTDMLTPTYVWIRKADAETLAKFKEAMAKCTFKEKVGKEKEYKVRISAFKPNTIIKKEEPKKKKPSANTDEVRRAAKAARKMRKKQHNIWAHEYALNRKVDKVKLFAGRKAKLYYINESKEMVRKQHSRTGTITTLDKKRAERAKKAGKAVVQVSTQKPVRMAANSLKKPVKKGNKGKQLELDFNKKAALCLT